MAATVGQNAPSAQQKRDVAQAFGLAQAHTPVMLVGSTAIDMAAHGNRDLIVSSATACVLTLPETAGDGDRIYGVNVNAGAVTIRRHDGTPVLGHAILPDGIDQYSAFEVRYLGGQWVRVA
jgi:hypothetical protein